MLYGYKLFDLAVSSEIPLPEAIPLASGDTFDVTIRRGSLSLDVRAHPVTIYHDEQKQWWTCLPSPNRFLFNNIAGEIEVIDGREIVINDLPDADEHYLRAFILGTSFGALQMQRGRIPVHGSAIAAGNRTLIITGPQGAGKSTLTGAMIAKGYRYLSDDVSPISLDNGVFYVHPAYPQRKLCRDACIAQGYNPDELIWINEDRDKFALRRLGEWHDKRMPLGMLVEIVPEDTDTPRVVRVEGQNKLRLLFENIYRTWIFQTMGIPPEKMKTLLTLTSNTEMYRIFRPKTLDAIDMVAEVIIGKLLK